MGHRVARGPGKREAHDQQTQQERPEETETCPGQACVAGQYAPVFGKRPGWLPWPILAGYPGCRVDPGSCSRRPLVGNNAGFFLLTRVGRCNHGDRAGRGAERHLGISDIRSRPAAQWTTEGICAAQRPWKRLWSSTRVALQSDSQMPSIIGAKENQVPLWVGPDAMENISDNSTEDRRADMYRCHRRCVWRRGAVGAGYPMHLLD